MKKFWTYLLIFLIISLPLCFATEISYQYDANGNLIEDEQSYYEYDGFNQLIRVRQGSSSGAIIEEYFYDYNGNRILKIHYTASGNESTYYLENNFVHVMNGTSVANTTYYYAGNILLAHKNASGIYYYHPDYLGSTSLITDRNGNVVEETRYGPFGDVLSGGNNRYLYTGKELDDLGLYYYGARYYKQNFYHFSQPDPIIQDVYDPQNLNRFAYVRNNPYRYVDPTGNYISPLDALDYASFADSSYRLYNNPSLENAGWFILDAVFVALPFVGGVGAGAKGLKYGSEFLGESKNVAKIVEKIDKHLIHHVKGGLSERQLLKASETSSKSFFSNLVNAKELTKQAFKEGTSVKEGLKVYDVGKTVGYSGGKSTEYLAVRYTDLGKATEMHSYPITRSEYYEKLKSVK